MADVVGDMADAEPGAVRSALDAVLASEPFHDSPQLRAFLRYVVVETLEGRAADLKGYTIATMALGRPDSFDPQTDPIVRVQAGRVRQALTEYYAAHPDAPVRIELERGVYAPRFRTGPASRPAAATAASAAPESGPDVTLPSAPVAPVPGVPPARRFLAPLVAAAVLVAAGAGAMLFLKPSPPGGATAAQGALRVDDFFPTLFVEREAIAELPEVQNTVARIQDAISRFDDLVLVGDASDMSPTVQASPKRHGWRMSLRLNADPAGPGQVRIRARLLDKFDQQVIWSREFDPVQAGPEGDAGRTAIVRTIATSLAQPYGVIHAHVRAHLDVEGSRNDPYGCIVAGLDYWLVNDRKTHGEARKCLMEKLTLYPTFGALHAQLTYLHLEEYRQCYNPLPGDARARAAESARRAVQFRPASARSHQALLAALFASGDMDGAWRAAGDALTLNPYDTEIIADVGSYHVLAGDFEKGLRFLNTAIELNAAPPAWVLTYRAMALYMLGRIDQSGPMVNALEGSNYPAAMMALVLQAFQYRNVEAGKRQLSRFRAEHPQIAADPTTFLTRMNFNPDTAVKIVFDYNRAVAWITGQAR